MKTKRMHDRTGRTATHSSRARALGKYRLVERLGHGGMGIVYRAVDETLDREVAIKFLHSKRADPRVIKRLRTEATTLARLNHPEIATVYELFEADNALLLVMELVRGETLESICDRMQALPPIEAASVVDKILSALQYAHGAGVVHCDIKPANVMVIDGGAVKIMDFGTARMREPRTENQEPGTGSREPRVRSRFTTGTPAYMSPEQVLGQDVDGRADLYAVGVVLYRLLTAKLPFTGANAIAIARQHIAEAPTPLSAHRNDLPGWCATIVERALAKSPDARFQTAAEFREALRNATGMTATGLGLAFTISVKVPEGAPMSRPAVRTRVLPAGKRRRATVTIATDDAGRTQALFRGVVKRRSRDVVPKNRRAFLAGVLGATIAAMIGAAAIVGRYRPPAPSAPDTTSPIVFSAKSCAPRTSKPRDTTCQVVLSDDRISVKANDTNKQLHDVSYTEVRSVSYSHGLKPNDPPRVSLRTTNAKSDLIVLRFDKDAPARQAVGEIEKRTDRHATVTPSRETPESVR